MRTKGANRVNVIVRAIALGVLPAKNTLAFCAQWHGQGCRAVMQSQCVWNVLVVASPDGAQNAPSIRRVKRREEKYAALA
jgi:hypothetical protein